MATSGWSYLTEDIPKAGLVQGAELGLSLTLSNSEHRAVQYRQMARFVVIPVFGHNSILWQSI